MKPSLIKDKLVEILYSEKNRRVYKLFKLIDKVNKALFDIWDSQNKKIPDKLEKFRILKEIHDVVNSVSMLSETKVYITNKEDDKEDVEKKLEYIIKSCRVFKSSYKTKNYSKIWNVIFILAFVLSDKKRVTFNRGGLFDRGFGSEVLTEEALLTLARSNLSIFNINNIFKQKKYLTKFTFEGLNKDFINIKDLIEILRKNNVEEAKLNRLINYVIDLKKFSTEMLDDLYEITKFLKRSDNKIFKLIK